LRLIASAPPLPISPSLPLLLPFSPTLSPSLPPPPLTPPPPFSAAPQVGNDNRMLWYAAGYWYLGKKNELGKSQGWLCVRDPAPAPELVQSCWRVGDGERLHQVH
jgi:hypothetical protein